MIWNRALARCAVLAALLILSCSTSRSQASPPNAKQVVEQVARALGAANLNSIQYSGKGFTYFYMQNYSVDGPFPKFYARYTRDVDYEKGLSRENILRSQLMSPPRGGGEQPMYREGRRITVASETSDWDGGAVALTPHGWVKAAMTANPEMKPARVGGKPGRIVTFSVRGKYRVEGYVNSENLLEKVNTWVSTPILGDTLVETTFSGYREIGGGVKFPMKIAQKLGPYTMLELEVTETRPNVPMEISLPPAPPPLQVESQKIADGVWYLAGTDKVNSQVVEFKDFVVLIESSTSEERALANIAEAKRLVPGKPIRYHLNSHHHGDHLAGLRAFVAEGSTIITHEMNKRFYRQVVLKTPHTLVPDNLSRNPRPAKFIWVKDKYVLTDGDRSLEIYFVPTGHSENQIMGYLPKEGVLFVTDMLNIYVHFGEVHPNDPPAGVVSPYTAEMGQRIKQLNLDVQQVAVSHAKQAVPAEVLWKAMEGTVQVPPPAPLD